MPDIRDRIIDFRRVRAHDLLPHPANWRRHPAAQQQALRGLLEEIGYAGALLTRQLPSGQLQIIDGHLRAETTPDQDVPVLVLDVTEAEAEKLLLTLDPLAALATRDDTAIRALLERVETSSTEVRAFLDGLAAQLPPLLGEKKALEAKPLPPGFADIRCGHVLEQLRAMPDNSVHCVMTSPPYWGLRDYGIPPVAWPDGWEGALGLEPTPALYVQHMVEVFREVRRVLRDDGTVWLNLGDSYASASACARRNVIGAGSPDETVDRPNRLGNGVKEKDLLGMPWRVAFALQADGWYLRSDIIWAKPNPMPESVTDRPTKAHEYVFLVAKSEQYYYDADAIREPLLVPDRSGTNPRYMALAQWNGRDRGRQDDSPIESNPAGRNKRTVWEIPTQPYPDAHFATFPEALVEPCVLAGTSERGCCAECGAPWERDIEATGGAIGHPGGWGENANPLVTGHQKTVPNTGYRRDTIGWHPTCDHQAEARPCIVLDPFAGSGTTLVVGKRLGRSVVGIELNPEYCALITHRLAELVPEG